MLFSIILASRQRTKLLHNLLFSLKDRSADTKHFEALIVIDTDDGETQMKADEFHKEFPFAKFISRERSQWLNRDYINKAAELAQGKYLCILNDDVQVRTLGWDVIAYDKLEQNLKGDGILYGLTDDGSDHLREWQGLEYSSFPIISKQAANVLSWAMPSQYRSWSADVFAYKVFKSVDRVLNMKEILFFHDSHHNHTRATDAINLHVQYLAELEGQCEDPRFDIAKLREYIRRFYLNTECTTFPP